MRGLEASGAITRAKIRKALGAGMPRQTSTLIVVLGPTASGKSKIALRLAEDLGGEIVGCDSMQVYRGFDAGTAKPSLEERRMVPHHLLDVADPGQDFNLGDYVRQAESAVNGILTSGRTPVIAGGTGLYLQGLLRGIFEGPRRDEALRAQLVDLERRRPGILHRFLRRVDPGSALRLPPRDLQRIVRALEVYVSTGRSLSEAFALQGAETDRWPAVKIGLMLPRPLHWKRIAERVDQFFEAGWEREVRGLLEAGLPESANAWKALGYRHVARLVRGETTRAEARETIVRETRQYAKRQMTWFRREPGVVWFQHEGEPPWESIRDLAARALSAQS